MENRPKRNIIKPLRFQTTSSDEAEDSGRKTTELQGTQLEKDVAELRGVLEESHSPGTNMHANHSLTNSQSFTESLTQHKHLLCMKTQSSFYAQPSTVTHTTQAPFMHENTQSSSYTQPSTVTHTTQASFMHENTQSSSYAQSSAVTHTTQAPLIHENTQLSSYAQPSTVTHTTQASLIHENTQSSSYAQPSTVTHTTQAPFMHENTQSSSYAQPSTVTHTTQAPFMHKNTQSSFYAQPSAVTHTTQAPLIHENTQSSSYAQPSTVTHTTQAPLIHENTQSSSYAQLSTVTHTTQAPFMHENTQSSSYAQQNFHDTTQTFTHKPHAAATHTQHIDSQLNTPHNTQLQPLNIWPILSSSHLSSSSLPSQASREFYNFHVRPEIQAIHGRMDQLALEVQQIHQKLDRVLTQISNNRKHMPEKPAFLPLSLVEDVEIFETANDEEYMKLVNYLIFIGGLNAKESVNLCFKEIFQDSLMNLYTWFGREDNQRPLYSTRLVNAIYDAICENKNFERPMRAAFQTYMWDALRTAKQRHRNRARNNLHRPEGRNRNEPALWNDEHDEMQPEEN
ncbi:cell wall protein DAN4-like [Nylanderia fulva]|uniref:cell wall protein DAN4-like n=1 Tax=Nylanderia fulva TaxID=613905 RepID=UPI0010FB134F|nr:cell wall protein DAN4-like [Nylanderia fulva]